MNGDRWGEETQRRFVAAVLKDDTDARRQSLCNLSSEIFTDRDCARAWRAVRGARTYKDAAVHEHVRLFWAVETSEMTWHGDLLEAQIAQTRLTGKWFNADMGGAAYSWPEPTTAAELCAKLPPPVSCIVDGLLIEGGLTICSAPSKGRKSWLSLDLGLSVSSGADFLGWATRQAPVIYLNFELQQDTVHRRLWDIAKARGVSAPKDLHLVNLRGKIVNAADLRRNLAQLCVRFNPSMILLDPFYKVSANSGAEENSNDGQARLLAEIEATASECGAALFATHHFSKGNASMKNAIDRASGAGALARAPDAVMTLTEHEEDDACTMEVSLRDLPPVAPVAMRWEYPCWMMDETLDPKRLRSKGGAPRQHSPDELVNALRDGMSNADWRQASQKTETTFRRLRDELTKSGKVTLRSGFYYHAKP